MDDYEVKRTIWESKVPVEFTIDSEFTMNSRSHSLFVSFFKKKKCSKYLKHR